MPRSWQLQDFSGAAPSSAQTGVTEDTLEEERLASFDRGYKAGWEDAASAHEAEQGRVAADFAQTLNDLSFSYHEARSAMLKEMSGVVQGLVGRVLAPSAAQALGDHVLEKLKPLIADRADLSVVIQVSATNVPVVEKMALGITQPRILVQASETLGDGQAILQLGDGEQRIDLDAVLQEAAEMVADFFAAVPETPREEKKVG